MIVFTFDDITTIAGIILLILFWLVFNICLKIKNGVFRTKKNKGGKRR